MEAIAIRMEAIAIRMEAIATRLCAFVFISTQCLQDKIEAVMLAQAESRSLGGEPWFQNTEGTKTRKRKNRLKVDRKNEKEQGFLRQEW